jgi:carbon starvation protein
VAAWAYFVWAGSISTIWPMFGIAICVFVILASAMMRWVRVLNGTVKSVPVG